MGAAQSANVRLIEQLVRKHESVIRQFIARRSGPEVLKRATVDDIFQETVVAAYKSADNFEFRDDRRFIAWIGTIARRVISRCAGGAKQDPQTIRIRGSQSSGNGVPDADLTLRARTPSSLAAEREYAAMLKRAIQRLPQDYRRVLTLYKLEERPLAEVAESMGRSKGAICRLIDRAMEQLRTKLADDDELGRQ